jgi:hypothetical protein
MSGFGRIPQFDERSRAYPIRGLFATPMSALPLRSYTWSVPASLDQGSEGACVGFSYTHELMARPVSVLGLSNEAARELYWAIQREDPWDGGAYPGAAPFYEGTSVLTGVKVVTDLGHYSAYHWAFSEREMAMAIGYKGPVVIGINWYTGMMQPDDNGYLHPTGVVEGGHAIMVNSVSVRYNRYRVHNSWGPGWAFNGGAYVSRDDMATLLAQEGECCLPVRRRL